MKTIFFLIATIFCTDFIFAANFSNREIENEIKSFHENSATYMNKLAPKKGAINKTKFTDKEINSNDFITKKIKFRKSYFNINANPKNLKSLNVEPKHNDRVQNLVENPIIITSLTETDKYREGKVAVQPWSDDYWPIYQGVLGKRYVDQDFEYLSKWNEFFDFIVEKPAYKIYQEKNLVEIDNLSPAEKYDLLMDNQTYMLTRYSWSQGKQYFDAKGEVEAWMGICHGWAPAAYMLERPLKKVTLMSHDNVTPITFYPSDIKALASLLWANTQTPTRFVGGRCNNKEPEQNEAGRVTDDTCFDTNPATWHLSVINQVGVLKRSFVIDATYDYEVWNQPVSSYNFIYFNPESNLTVDKVEDAIINIEDYSKDKFKEFRSPRAKKVIGVAMQLNYLVETSPTHSDTDDETLDDISTVIYIYDLEIDENGEIIGGEWYNNTHPDFLWTPTQDSKALSHGDFAILSEPLLDGKTAIPNSWKRYLQIAAQSGQPLAKIIDSLIKLSRE